MGVDTPTCISCPLGGNGREDMTSPEPLAQLFSAKFQDPTERDPATLQIIRSEE
jgi:hypothetical protein